MDQLHNRRAFLRAAVAAGAAWAAADFVEIEHALAFAAQQAALPGADRADASAFTRAEADAVAAMTARIIPAVDGRPGAYEAGAVMFIDRALATFNASQKPLYTKGVADLNKRAARRWKVAGFAALTPAQQDAVLHEIEKTPFFRAARVDTIVGTLGLPTRGGNRDYAGWRLLGLEHAMSFQAPFGYYDAEANRSR